MKYLKIFEDFERGIAYRLPEKQCRMVKDKYLWINDPSNIMTDGSSYFLGDEIYDNLDDVIDNMFNYFGIDNYKIENNKINVNGGVDISDKELNGIPFNFGSVTEHFICCYNNLTTLKGCPESVGGHFKCNNNKLISLEHCSKQVGWYFDCSYNQLTTLEGCPQDVGDFDCRNNKLTTLNGSPKEILGKFECQFNLLTSLEGGPLDVTGNYICHNNKLETLKGAPNNIGSDFVCYHNFLKNLKFLPENIDGYIYMVNIPTLTDFSDVSQEMMDKIKTKYTVM